jgi:phosphonate transport system substrate-binding protein
MGKVKRFLGLSLVFLLIGLYSFVFAADIPDTLRIGLLPAEDAATMIKQFQGIQDHIGKTVGLPTKVWVSQSYNALIEAMNAGHIDVAYLGGSQYVAAREAGIPIEPVAVAVMHTGYTYYNSCIIVLAKSDIKTVRDLKGRTLALVAPTSTSGGVGPFYLLNRAGLDPGRDLKRLVYAGKHDSVYLAVKNEKVDAGGTGSTYFYRGILDFEDYIEEATPVVIKKGTIRVVDSVRVPGTPMCARKALGRDFIEKLRAGFRSIPKEVAIQYKIWGALYGFQSTSDKDYDELAAMKKLQREMEKKKK